MLCTDARQDEIRLARPVLEAELCQRLREFGTRGLYLRDIPVKISPVLESGRQARKRKLDQAPIGAWDEGIAFSRDGHTILVQGMQDREIYVFRWDGHKLTPGSSLAVKDAGPAAFATAWP